MRINKIFLILYKFIIWKKIIHFIISIVVTKTENSLFLINTSIKVIPLCGIMISLKLFHTDV